MDMTREEASDLAYKTWAELTQCVAECGETEEEFRAAGIEGREMDPGIWAGWDGGDLWVSVLFRHGDELWQAVADADEPDPYLERIDR